MINKIYQFIAKISPALGAFIRESYYTLNGWRFNDLKQVVIANKHNFSSHSFQWTLESTSIASIRKKSQIAFITCLPPAETGIATCSLHSWLTTDLPVDIFCPSIDDDWFFGLQLFVERQSAGQARIFDVNSFLSADMNQRYKFIVIAVGNSIHNAYIMPLIDKLSSFSTLDRITLYIHDPCCLDLLTSGLPMIGPDINRFVSYLIDIYPELSKMKPNESKTKVFSIESLADSGIMGLRYFHQKGINRFIVNSDAAMRLVNADINSDNAFVDKLFHPIFSPINEGHSSKSKGYPTGKTSAGAYKKDVSDRQGATFRVGTFGILNDSKCTDLILHAVDHLIKNGINIHLTLAGYNAHEYCYSHARELAKIPHIIVNAPTDLQLWMLMSQVDLAVQLRLKNRGESSGIVAQLIKLNKPMVLTDIGSFSELGRVLGRRVVNIPPMASSKELAESIQNLLDAGNNDNLLGVYAADHSPAMWRSRLYEILQARAASSNEIDIASNKRISTKTTCIVSLDDPRDEYIKRLVPNKSFVDIGGLSNVINERVSIAAEAGAKSVCMIDVEDEQCVWWKALADKLKADSIVCDFISADILKYESEPYDVVHSSGVLYHLPKPMEYLLQLRRMTKEYCILTSTTISCSIETKYGYLELPKSAILFIPALTGREKKIIKEWFLLAGRGDVTECVERFGGWNNEKNYYPNWFIPTVSAFKEMAYCAGFEIVDGRAVEKNDYSYCLLLKPRTTN